MHENIRNLQIALFCILHMIKFDLQGHKNRLYITEGNFQQNYTNHG